MYNFAAIDDHFTQWEIVERKVETLMILMNKTKLKHIIFFLSGCMIQKNCIYRQNNP